MSTIRLSTRSNRHSNPPAAASPGPGRRDTGGPTAAPASLQRAFVFIRNHDYEAAIKLLNSAGREEAVRNALGVCLMRRGLVDEAVSVFRGFVLRPGTVIERADIDDLFKRNFAVSLLLAGHPDGALEVLAETRQPDHPAAIALHKAIRQWEQSLSWWRRIDWKLNRIVPVDCRVPLGNPVGEWGFGLVDSPRILSDPNHERPAA